MVQETLLPYQLRQVPEDTLPHPVEARPIQMAGPHVRIYSSEDRTCGGEVKWAAQKLQTDVYLGEGFITKEDLDPFGMFIDEYVDRSAYTYVKNSNKVVAGRQIYATRKEGMMSLPTARHFVVNPDLLCQVAGVESVADIGHKEVVEISGLASMRIEGEKFGDLDAVRALYSQLLKNSLEKGHKLWLMNIDPKFARVMGFLIGSEQVHVLGEPQKYMGSPTIPVAINPRDVVRKILASEDPRFDAQKRHLRSVFTNINDRKIPKDIRDLLSQNNIWRQPHSETARLLTSPMAIGQAAIMAYSMSRAIPASNVQEFGGDGRILWLTDVATSPLYALGVGRMFFGKSVASKIGGASLALPSFLAPYIYYYASGEGNYPMGVNAAVAGFVGGAVLKEVIGRRRRNRKEERIVKGLLKTAPDTV